jgi:ABC-type antimicrobial peptide transport system permease subunit
MTQKQFNFVSYVVVIIAGSLLYTILGVVLSNVNKAKRKDFTILRSIGANRSYLARQVMIEQIIEGVIAFIFVVVFFFILGEYNYTISETMRHVQFSQYFILFIISILLSIQVSLRFNRRIFNFSIISSLNESEESK